MMRRHVAFDIRVTQSGEDHAALRIGSLGGQIARLLIGEEVAPVAFEKSMHRQIGLIPTFPIVNDVLVALHGFEDEGAVQIARLGRREFGSALRRGDRVAGDRVELRVGRPGSAIIQDRQHIELRMLAPEPANVVHLLPVPSRRIVARLGSNGHERRIEPHLARPSVDHRLRIVGISEQIAI